MQKKLHDFRIGVFIVFASFFLQSTAQTAIRFNSKSVQEVTIPDLRLSDSFTIEAMVYLENASDYGGETYTEQDTLSLVAFGGETVLGISGNGFIHLGAVGRSTNLLRKERWRHIAVSYDNVKKETQFYFEGQKDGTISDMVFTNTATEAVFGLPTNMVDFFGGIDDLRIWNTVRTHAEILTNIENCYIQSDPDLVALYSFNESDGTLVTDSSGNGYNGTAAVAESPIQLRVPQNRCFEGLSDNPCSDGIDNDGDGLIDCEDSDECTGRTANDGCTRCGDSTSFADEVIAHNPTCLEALTPDLALASNALGIPDNRQTSLGEGGSVSLKFTDNFLTNSGDMENDLFVFETGSLAETTNISFRPANDFTLAQVENLNIPDENGDGFFEFGRIEGATRGVDIDVLIPGYRKGQLKFDAINLADIEDRDCGPRWPGADINAVCALSSLRITAPDLTVNRIDFEATTIAPGEELILSWFVENLGSMPARGGWTEEAFLVVEGSDERYLLGKTAYFDVLEGNFDVAREISYQLPDNLGVDGSCIIELIITPNNQIVEGDNGITNNTVQSGKTIEVEKTVRATLNKLEIAVTAQDSLGITLLRSGRTTLAEDFTIESSQNNFFILPQTVTIPEGQNQITSYIGLQPNATATNDQPIMLTVTALGYPEVTTEFTLLANEKFDLALSHDTSFTNAPDGSIDFSLTTKGDASAARTINLQSSPANRITLPETVTIPVGATSLIVQGTITSVTGSTNAQKVQVTARGMEEATAFTKVTLAPFNIPEFELIVSSTTVSEGDGAQATSVTLRRNTLLEQDIQVRLRASSTNTLTFPKTLILESTEEEITFSLGVLENTIVEDTRTVGLAAYLVLDSCNCINTKLPETQAVQNITVLDNDGPSLVFNENTSILSNTNTSTEIMISRPSGAGQDITEPLTVNLSSADAALISVPTSIIIPAGKDFVTIPVSLATTIDGITNTSVVITATTEGINGTTTRILVTGQQRADLSIALQDIPISVDAGSVLTIQTQLTNNGLTSFPKGATLNYYLSENNDIDNQTPILATLTDEVVAQGESTTLQETIQLPNVTGTRFLIAAVNANGVIDELTTENNVIVQAIELIPSYDISLAIEKEQYMRGETVAISGVATRSNDTPAALADAQLTIKTPVVSRNFDIKTTAYGTFEWTYTPLANEVGIFEVTAAFPGTVVEPQAQFYILGFKWISKPSYVRWEPVVGIPLEREITLENMTSIPLRNVRIELPDNADFTINQTPLIIAPGTKETFTFTIISTIATAENAFEEIPIRIVSDEGAILEETIYYYSRAKEAKFLVAPISINTTMVKDTTRIYEFTVQNIGETTAKDVQVRIPELPWMQLRSPAIIPALEKGETAAVALALTPTDAEQLNVPIRGNLLVEDAANASISVPFRIEPVSESIGSFVVTTTDEYTFNTPAKPKLAGAQVTIKRPFSGAVVAEGITNIDGVFEVPELNEGFYTIDITSDKHSSYQNNITIEPSRQNTLEAFLPYEAVTYTWDVTRIEIEDQYEVKLTTQFETNVPKPVVVMELDDTSLNLAIGETKIVNLNVTNHGLIEANDVKISTRSIAGYEIIPSITSLEIVRPKSAVQIPVELRRIADGGGNGAGSGGSPSGGDGNDLGGSDSGGSDGSGSGSGGSVGGSSDDGSGAPGNPNSPTSPEVPAPFPGPKTCTNIFVILNATYPCGGEDRTLISTVAFDRVGECSYGTLPRGVRGGGSGGNLEVRNLTLTEIDFCDPCITKLASFLLKYGGGKRVKPILCLFNYMTSSTPDRFDPNPPARKFVECLVSIVKPKPAKGSPGNRDSPDWKKPVGFISDVLKLIDACYDLVTGKGSNKKLLTDLAEKVNSDSSGAGVFDFIKEDFEKIQAAYEAHELIEMEYFIQNPTPDDMAAYAKFMSIVNSFIAEEKSFSSEDIVELKSSLIETAITFRYIDAFTTRWNQTVIAWGEGILSPNAEYPNIVDYNKVQAQQEVIEELNRHSFERGFISVLDMFESDVVALESFVEEKSQESGSVCSSVTLEFNQTATITREAFEGVLRINNASDQPLRDIQLDLVVTDENGVDQTALFQINKEAFLSGEGFVEVNGENSGTAIFIPTKEAASQVPIAYNFGGVLSYFDENIGDRVTAILNPVTLEVNPSPDLILDYFVQRNILGDDALTETVVEPSIPAELSVMITNDGFGTARNVKIASAQPEIIDNEKGLLIDFEIIGSNLNNDPTNLGLLNIDFGAIAPKATTVGQWFFTSSLLGRFVSYELEVNHTTDFGNEALSLIKEANVHELIKSVRNYGEGTDEIAEFLVNDRSDAADTPDAIYFSDGTNTEVRVAEEATLANTITTGALTTQLTAKPATPGWTYGIVDDPGLGQYEIAQVIRDSDQVVLPLENFWQTFVTLPDGLNPRYDNKLHFVDNISGTETYTLSFISKDASTFTATINGLPEEEKTDQAVTSLEVIFDKPIDATTFTTDDLKLVRQGEFIETDAIAITAVSDTAFTLDLTALTTASGFYELDLSLIAITSLEGNTGTTVTRATWIQFIDQLGVLRFASGQQDQEAIDQLDIIFNKPLASPELLQNYITINGNATAGLIVTPITELQYQISGLRNSNQTDGAYQLGVDMTQLQATDGIAGFAVQNYNWNVDQTPPEIITMSTQSQGTTNGQFVSQVDIRLNEPLAVIIPDNAIQLVRDGAVVTAPIRVQQRDSLTYMISGLGAATQANGAYQLVVDKTAIRDINENQNSGQEILSWTVNVSAVVGFESVGITPDLGNSDADNVTSGSEVAITYVTTADELFIDIYEIVDGNPIRLSSEFRAERGTYQFPLVGALGDRNLQLVAQDTFGNSSKPQLLNTFIDFVPLQLEITPVKNNDEDACYGFDRVLLTFSEAIVTNSFTKEAITFEIAGIKQDIPFELVQVDETTFVIRNIAYALQNSLTLNVDQSAVHKASSGLVTSGVFSADLGLPNTFAVTLEGLGRTDLDNIVDYTATGALSNGDWVVINGEILESTENTVKIKWLAEGLQSVLFRYQTALGCQATQVKNVIVGDAPLSVPDIEEGSFQMFLSPVPNNGIFTIHTSQTLADFAIAIFDLSGKQVYFEEGLLFSEKLKKIDVSYLAAGIYSLKVQSRSLETDMKFVIE